MHVEDLRAYLLAKPGATEELPFGPQALVFKVKGKMFALVAWNMVDLDGSVPEPEIQAMVDDSYDLVVQGLPKTKREKVARVSRPRDMGS
jgi:predicted DNA-binding protein (MmcQ/YjbR family)